jgi:hypothetical protein
LNVDLRVAYSEERAAAVGVGLLREAPGRALTRPRSLLLSIPEDRGVSGGLEYRAADIAGMTNKPEPPTPVIWNIYKIAAKAVRLGEVEAPDESTAIERGAAEFRVPKNRLMAIRR